MAVRIADKKCLILLDKYYFLQVKNAAGYRSGPLTPSTVDGDQLCFQDSLLLDLIERDQATQVKFKASGVNIFGQPT